MATVIDLTHYKSEAGSTIAPPLLAAKPLSQLDMSCLQRAFKENRYATLWCGYATLSEIPRFMNIQGILSSIKRPAGVTLFTSSPQNTYFVFRDTGSVFYLTDKSGQTLQTHRSLPTLLEIFQQNLRLL